MPGVAVLAAIVALLAVALASPPGAAAHEAHPNMAYDMEVRWAVSGQCLSYGGPGACNVGVGRVFEVRAGIATNHGLYYDETQFALEYSGVTPKGTPDIELPTCGTRTDPDPQPAGKVIASCTHAPSYSAAIASFRFTCTPTPSSGHVLTLRIGTGDEETFLQDTLGERHTAAADDTVTINCVEPSYADMSLNAQGPNVSCDDTDDPASCDVDVGDAFTLVVETDNPPADGYTIAATYITYAGLTYKPVPDGLYTFENEGAEAEVVWPGSEGYDLRFPFQPSGTEGFVQHAGYDGQPDYAGNLVEIALTCTTPGSFVVGLPALDPPAVTSGASFYSPTERVYLNSGDQLTINCIAGEQAPTSTPTPAAPPAPPTPASLGGISLRPPADRGDDASRWPLGALAVAALALAGGGAAARLRTRR